jgi:peptide/nickel transport system permease protein
MLGYLQRRLISMIITLLVTSIIIFVMSEIIPVDPARSILGQYTTDENIAALRLKMGLDRPVPERYVTWLWHFVRGDLGDSYRLGTAIRPLVLTRFRNSMILAVAAMLILVPFSLGCGIIAGLREGRWQDWIFSSSALLTTSLPEFVTGILLIMVFAWWLKWLPGNSLPTEEGANPLSHASQLVLPAMTLALTQFGYVTRITRVSIAKVMKAPYIRTAILKGLPYRTVVIRHALRNALLAPITVLTTQFGWMIGGLIVIESVFSYPGLGRLFASAALFNDIPMLEASAMLGIVIAVGSQLLADLSYALLNPRIRYGRS